MQNIVPRTARKPALNLPQRRPSSPPPPPPPPPPPRRMPNVAFRDNQFPREDSPQDLSTNSATVLDLAAVEPVKAARRCRAAIAAATGGFHKEMRQLIAEAYAVARALQKNRQAWRTFIEDEFWQHRKRPPKMDDRGRPLLHVMVFVFGAIDRNIYKRAQKYAAGLKQYWIDNVPAREVAAKIEEDGGIEALSQASAESKPKKKQKPEQSSKLTFSASEARRGSLLALSEGQAAHLIIRRVTGERGVVARIVRFDPVKT
jgi:hypothetical protein